MWVHLKALLIYADVQSETHIGEGETVVTSGTALVVSGFLGLRTSGLRKRILC